MIKPYINYTSDEEIRLGGMDCPCWVTGCCGIGPIFSSECQFCPRCGEKIDYEGCDTDNIPYPRPDNNCVSFDWDREKRDEVLKIIRDFIIRNNISCAEAIQQSDKNILESIELMTEIVELLNIKFLG